MLGSPTKWQIEFFGESLLEKPRLELESLVDFVSTLLDSSSGQPIKPAAASFVVVAVKCPAISADRPTSKQASRRSDEKKKGSFSSLAGAEAEVAEAEAGAAKGKKPKQNNASGHSEQQSTVTLTSLSIFCSLPLHSKLLLLLLLFNSVTSSRCEPSLSERPADRLRL